MIEVVVEVGSGATRFNVAVRAESIRGARDIVKAQYLLPMSSSYTL